MNLIDNLRGVMYAPKGEAEKARRRLPVLDGASEDDVALDAAAEFEAVSARMDAVSAIQQWVEDSDLDDGEGSADRLLALMIGIADSNKDGELSEDEHAVILEALEAAWDLSLIHI